MVMYTKDRYDVIDCQKTKGCACIVLDCIRSFVHA